MQCMQVLVGINDIVVNIVQEGPQGATYNTKSFLENDINVYVILSKRQKICWFYFWTNFIFFSQTLSR